MMVYADSANSTIESLIDKTKELYGQGKHGEAILLADDIIKTEPNNIDALNLKGASLIALKKYEEAISYFDHILEIEPNNLKALNNKGGTLNHLGRYVEALTYFDKVLKIDPGNKSADTNFDYAKERLQYISVKGIAEVIVHDSQGHIIGYTWTDDFFVLDDNDIGINEVQNWPIIKKITEKNQKFAVHQYVSHKIVDLAGRSYGQSGLEFSQYNDVWIVFTHNHQIPLEKGDQMTFIFSYFESV